jgi:hypothetical protein
MRSSIKLCLTLSALLLGMLTEHPRQPPAAQRD